MNETSERVIWTVRDFPSLLDGLRARIRELDVTAASIEQSAGLTDRYVSKMLRRIPLSKMRPLTMGLLLQALGVKLLLVEDAEQMERLKRRLERRVSARVQHIGEPMRTKAVRTKAHKQNPLWEARKGDSEWGRTMRLRGLTLLTPAFVLRNMRKAAKARWQRAKKDT